MTENNFIVQIRLHCARCGKFTVSSIPMPKDDEVLEVICNCEYILGEYFRFD